MKCFWTAVIALMILSTGCDRPDVVDNAPAADSNGRVLGDATVRDRQSSNVADDNDSPALDLEAAAGIESSDVQPNAETETVKPEETLTADAGDVEPTGKVNARDVLATAIADAASQQKRVFVNFGAPW